MSNWLQLKDPALFRQQCFIDGAWSEADDGRRFEVKNPATSAVIGSVPRMAAGETRRAIAAASRAFGPWRKKSGKKRAQHLRKWFELILDNQHGQRQLHIRPTPVWVGRRSAILFIHSKVSASSY